MTKLASLKDLDDNITRAQSAITMAEHALDDAMEAKLRMKHVHAEAEAEYVELKQLHDSGLRKLKRLQDKAEKQRDEAYQKASQACDLGNIELAAELSEEGYHHHKIAERHAIEYERTAHPIHRASRKTGATGRALKQAEDDHTAAKLQLDEAKAAYKSAIATRNVAIASTGERTELIVQNVKQARGVFGNNPADLRSLALMAGVPRYFASKTKATKDEHGYTYIYFGGKGAPDGPGCGMYVLDAHGLVVTRSNPLVPITDQRRCGTTGRVVDHKPPEAC